MLKKQSTAAYDASCEGPICFKPQNIYLKTYQPGVRPSCASIAGYFDILLSKKSDIKDKLNLLAYVSYMHRIKAVINTQNFC